MLITLNDGMLLKAETQSFPRKENPKEIVEFTRAVILDDQNEYHVCTVVKDHAESLLDLEARTEFRGILEITEAENDKGTYLKKKIVHVD